MTNRLHKGIKPTRQLLRVSQKALCERMGKAQAHVSAIETGRNNGSINFYENICEALGLPFIVLAMEALQVEEIRNKDMAEFLSIKEQLYRFLEINKVIKSNNDIYEGRKIADKLCKAEHLTNSLETLNHTQPIILSE